MDKIKEPAEHSKPGLGKPPPTPPEYSRTMGAINEAWFWENFSYQGNAPLRALMEPRGWTWGQMWENIRQIMPMEKVDKLFWAAKKASEQIDDPHPRDTAARLTYYFALLRFWDPNMRWPADPASPRPRVSGDAILEVWLRAAADVLAVARLYGVRPGQPLPPEPTFAQMPPDTPTTLPPP